MIPLWLNALILFALFFVLGYVADLTVNALKYLAGVFKLRLYLFGIVLGLVTSLPEFMVGVNATIDGVGALAVGNLLGGIVIIFGLILGTSLMLNGRIESHERLSTLLVTAGVIAAPVILTMDGGLSLLDGIGLVLLYLGLLVFQYEVHREREHPQIHFFNGKTVARQIVLAIGSMVAITVLANLIVSRAEDLTVQLGLSDFVVGILLFSFGTNLPEISIAITSWRKKSSELSLSHLVSSAFTNVLILGVLAIAKPIAIATDTAFIVLVTFYGLLLAGYVIFSWTGGVMTRREGAALVGLYGIFVASYSMLQFSAA